MAPIKKTPVAVPAAVATSAPVAKAPKPSKEAVVKPAVVAAVAPVVVEAATDVVVEETTSCSTLDTLEQKVVALAALAKEVLASLKVTKKEVEKMKKVADKAERKRANARTSPSGFAKPAKISDELCGFLGVEKGTEMSRTDVTRHINQYVKTHKLYKPDNKRVILPNAALKKLLGCSEGDLVTYFNLQRWLKGHFIKAAVVV